MTDRPYLKATAIVIVWGASGFEEEGGQAPVVYDFNLLQTASGTAATDIILDDGRSINYHSGGYNPIENGTESGIEYEISNQTFGGAFNSSGPHQTLDANDSYTAFGLDEDTDIDLLNTGARAARFYVASNAAFDIFGEASNLQSFGDFSGLDYSNIRYRLRVTRSGGGGANRWGANAQDPSAGGSGIMIGKNAQNSTLDDLTGGPQKVFDGGRRTALRRGGLMSQSVSFQSRYNLVGSSITANNYDFSMGVGGISADVTYTVYTP